jgi:protein TonB
MRVLPIASALYATLVACAAPAIPGVESQPAKDVVAYAPRPEYPNSAKKHGIGGGGVFVQHIDAGSGTVTSVTVKQSTGHALLDRCAVEALRRWRYKTPTKITTASIPITFIPEGWHVKK